MFNLFVCVSELSKLLGFFIPSLTYSSPPAISLRLLMTYLWCVSTPYTIRRPTVGSPPLLVCNSGSKSITLEKERYICTQFKKKLNILVTFFLLNMLTDQRFQFSKFAITRNKKSPR